MFAFVLSTFFCPVRTEPPLPGLMGVDPFKPGALFMGHSIAPDVTPQNAFCLHREILSKNEIKKVTVDSPINGSGIAIKNDNGG